jgi:methylenetetrahydrofolate reductase (NADPH)
MNLKRLANPAGTGAVSFEFFPPKTAEMETQLWNAIRRLEPLKPHFVSVTYGAGGSTRDRTHATVKRLVEETQLKPAAHLTCVGASKEAVNAVIRDYWEAGVRHIVALRGDMPEPHFEISVSAYPEKHPDSPSLEWDVDVLKAKVDAGATRAITQFAFDTELFPRFRDRAEKAGIHVPLVPGLMPTTNFKGVARMSLRCGATVPDWLAALYAGLDNDLESRKLVASAVLVEQVRELKAEGFDQFHFYTLNQAELTFAVCNMLGIKPAAQNPVAA